MEEIIERNKQRRHELLEYIDNNDNVVDKMQHIVANMDALTNSEAKSLYNFIYYIMMTRKQRKEADAKNNEIFAKVMNKIMEEGERSCSDDYIS